MNLFPFRRLLLACLLICSGIPVSYAQNKVSLVDGRSQPQCQACLRLVEGKPKEVLFGINIDDLGNVYFTMNEREFFDELFQGRMDGVTADLVSKDLYDCGKTNPSYQQLPKGQFLPPVYLADLKKNIENEGMGNFRVKIGTVPPSMKNKVKDVEGNLVIIKNGLICYYTHFLDIDRSLWELLPMGLYADTLISTQKLLDPGHEGTLLYTKKLQFTVPFAKNKASYNKADLKPLYDSLRLTDYRINKIDIRAYSSIEGAENLNRQLQYERGNSMVKALQQYQSPEIKNDVIATENWIEFFRDIKGTPFANWGNLSRAEIKSKLLDKATAEQIEPILKNHRKAIVTIYLDKKKGLEAVSNENLSIQFKNALAQKQLFKASLIQQEIYERIADNRLPRDYADKLEIPREKQYSFLLSDRETYKYQFGLTGEDEALENFKTLFKLDSTSSRIRYNICALTFTFWQHDTAFINAQIFLQDIHSLYRFKIDSALVSRMLINYHIVIGEHSMYRADYAAKDEALLYVFSNYAGLKLSDEEILALAKYLCFYAHCDAAEKLIKERAQSIDVNEDLLFYYLNLKFFDPGINYTAVLKTEINNAININRARFCKFFNSVNNGGASFQLLEDAALKSIYCEHCQVKEGTATQVNKPGAGASK